MINNEEKHKNNINLILKHLENDNMLKSSHWEYYLNGAYTSNKYIGFGSISNSSNILKNCFHFIFRNIAFFDVNIKNKEWFKLVQQICKKYKRIINVDVTRHIFTFDYLEQKLNNLNNIKSVCVIGDGTGNFVLPAYHSNKFNNIISVNLSEVLYHDYIYINSCNEFEYSIYVVETKDELNKLLKTDEKKIIFVNASNANILYNNNIDMFVNIVSMQEMNNSIVENYFNIIKSNKAYFYCCNRTKKVLPDNETLIFNKYPWGDNLKIIDDEYTCPWMKRFYNYKIPFIQKYDGNIQHRLVKFK